MSTTDFRLAARSLSDVKPANGEFAATAGQQADTRTASSFRDLARCNTRASNFLKIANAQTSQHCICKLLLGYAVPAVPPAFGPA